MNKTKLLALATVAAIGAGAAYFAISELRPRVGAAYWRQQIDAAPDGGVENVIGRIGETEGAIPALAEALGSERECVALAAKKELLARLDEWHKLPASQCAARVTELARALAERVDGFNPAGQRDAADVAVRILDRPIKGRGIDRQQYLAAGGKILHAGLNAKGEYSRKKAAETKPAELAEDEAQMLAELTGLQQSDADAGAVQKPKSEDKSKADEADDEEMQAADSAANRPWRLGHGLQDAARNRASRIPDVAEAGETAPVSAASNVAGGTADRRLRASLAGEDAIALIKDLNSQSDARADAAEAELIGRGFNATQLDLARKLFDPNPEVRKKLVQELPGLQDVDTVPWLLELCRDAESEVRLEAITILATSSDPAVLDQIEQIAGRDSDSSIRRVAERVEQRRSGRR